MLTTRKIEFLTLFKQVSCTLFSTSQHIFEPSYLKRDKNDEDGEVIDISDDVVDVDDVKDVDDEDSHNS